MGHVYHVHQYSKKKFVNYKDHKYHVANMLKTYQKLCCNMRIMVLLLLSHLERFLNNLGHVSEEQGGRFHQDVKVMKDQYQGRWNISMIFDYCSSVERDCPGTKHAKKSMKRKFLPKLTVMKFF